MLKGEGNHMVDIHRMVRECTDCDGSGKIDKDKLRDMITEYNLSFPVLAYLARKIKLMGECDCPVCQGKGYEETIY